MSRFLTYEQFILVWSIVSFTLGYFFGKFCARLGDRSAPEAKP